MNRFSTTPTAEEGGGFTAYWFPKTVDGEPLPKPAYSQPIEVAVAGIGRISNGDLAVHIPVSITDEMINGIIPDIRETAERSKSM